MAIIKYTQVNGRRPSGVTQGSFWHNSSDETFIGLGSGVGTELSIDELKAYVKLLPNIRHVEWDTDPEADASDEPTVNRTPTDADISSGIDAWCTEMGIS